MLNVKGINYDFNMPSKGKFQAEIQQLIAEGRPFMVKGKNAFSVFVPKDLIAFHSSGNTISKFESTEAMFVMIGITLVTCREVISERHLLANTLKLLQQ